MSQTRQVLLCGYGGQGIVLAGTLLGQAAFLDGKWVTGTNSYGAAARGGTCRAEIVIADQSIIFPYVTQADIIIAMSQTAYKKFIKQVNPCTGIVIADSGLIKPDKTESIQHIGIPATKTAVEQLGNEIVANLVMLGAASEITGIVSKNALVAAVKHLIPERMRELDIKAAEAGFTLAKNCS